MPNEVPLRPEPLPLPAIGFVGSSGSGKTTLLTAVLPHLRDAGLRVAVLKHARHGFDMDRPGKDSYRAREAGAAEVLVASRSRWVLLSEAEGAQDEPPFRELLGRFDRTRVDLVLVEGFAGEPYPKIEVYRPAHGEPPKCWPADPRVVAVATDA
ncbi:MAG TPA: molybdopterin-guanine dinucleotide biosynthesis protein B, partial [Gemmatimonadales bacterium]|nr:molybdopterin-guanine dinucleotide biosynthesis protein B [Gemmatimonadales bacterium]